MDVETLLVTRRCGQSCVFCARVAPSSVDPTLDALLARLDEAAAQGAHALVITGGEPLVRPDLEQLIRAATAKGFRSVTLETNATLLAGATPRVSAQQLRDAGVTAVRISVVTTDPAAHAALVSRHTTPRHVFSGLAACLDAGLDVSVRLPIARALPSAAGRVAGLRHAFPRLTTFELAVIGAGERTVATGAALSPADAAREVDDATQAAREHEATLTLASDAPLLPCLHPVESADARRLFARFLSHHEQPKPNDACAACADCALASRCRLTAAQVAAAAGSTPPTPVRDATPFLRPGKSPGSRLHVKQAADVEQFFHVDYEYDVDVSEPTTRLGILYRCNQVCTFCELADMDVELPPEKVYAAMAQARARGSKRLIVTGGEPTLSRHLVDYLARAKAEGFEEIEMQTNAVLLDKPGFAQRLRDAGLTRTQVSLHGPDSALSDALTAAPGTHRRTLGGIDKLLEAGVHVLINHLLFKDVVHLLDDFVTLAERRWGAHAKQMTLQFHSPRNEFLTVDEARAHVPRYSDYARPLRAAIDRARRAGFRVHDLQDPTGIPALCVLGADSSYLGPVLAQAERPRFHHWESEWLTHVPACERCDLKSMCMGVPRYYLALHGDAEFQPLKRAGDDVVVAEVA